MANSKSEKTYEINKQNRLRNRYYKTSVRTLVKLFFLSLESYKISILKTREIKQNFKLSV
jgi:ribosomal protein S20